MVKIRGDTPATSEFRLNLTGDSRQYEYSDQLKLTQGLPTVAGPVIEYAILAANDYGMERKTRE